MRIAGDGDYYTIHAINGAGIPVGKPYKLPSVTTILKALPKDGLQWWGYKMGLIEGRKLAAKHPIVVDSTTGEAIDDTEAFYEAAKKLGREGAVITPSNSLKTAGVRGTDVHDYAEQLLKSGKPPKKEDVPPEAHGYVTALVSWYDKYVAHRNAEVVAVEVPVFSLDHRFAGTLDAILKYKHADVTHYEVVDFKTSKGIYESHLIQVAAYRHAACEQGYIPEGVPVITNVARFGADGGFEVANSPFLVDDFLAVKQVWELLARGN